MVGRQNGSYSMMAQHGFFTVTDFLFPALLSVSRESGLFRLFWGVTRREFLYLDSLDFEAEDIQKVE